jgi:hypothetical protein
VDCISRPRARVGLILLSRVVGEFHQAEAEELTMLDTTPVTATIKRLIATGTTEQALLAAVARSFPDLSPAESQPSSAGGHDRGREAGR